MKKMIVFDLDGVLINSKKNMQVAWNEVNKKLNYSTKFSNYFNNIGLPFEDILKKIGIKRDIQQAKKYIKISQLQIFNLFKLIPMLDRLLSN